MRTTIALLAAFAFSAAAWAGSCPVHMKAIDAKLAGNPKLSKEDADKVARLRKSGEEHHKAGKHAESMKDLGEAKKILGM